MSEGKTETVVGHVPASWPIHTLESLAAFITKGGTPTTYGHDWADASTGIPFFRSECVTDNGFDPKGMNFISAAAHQQMIRSEVKPGDLLMTITGNVGRVAKAPGDCETANINQHIARIRILGAPEADADYVYHCLKHEGYAAYYRSILTGLAYPQISLQQVRETPVALPPPSERRKIASILTAVEDKLGVIARQIEATQTLKQGLMQTLFSRGGGAQDADGRWFPHNEFNDSVLGEIPTSWRALPIGDLFEVVERPVKMSDEKRYRRVTVKRRYGGIELRDELRGSEVKVKSQFELKEGDFLISERQIVHGACGIVPRPLAGALVSNEYLVLRATERVDVGFFNYLVQQLKYAKYFFLCSQGVDIEKFLFKPKDWLKKPVPVPPISEQTRIADVLSTVDSKLDALRRKHIELQQMKRGLMQKLLTGEWRVKVGAEMTA